MSIKFPGGLTAYTIKDLGVRRIFVRNDEHLCGTIEISTRGFRLGASVAINPDDETPIMLSLGIAPLQVYLCLEHPLAERLANRLPQGEYGARIAWDQDMQDITLRVDCGTDKNSESWRPFVLAHFKDVILGKQVYTQAAGIDSRHTIHFAEGAYEVRIVKSESSWERTRWPWASKSRAFGFEVLSGPGGRTSIPVPGKGESAHDCDDDGLSAGSMIAVDAMDCAGKLVAEIMRLRHKRGGPGWTPEPVRSAA